jgi:DNA topoisomerase-1
MVTGEAVLRDAREAVKHARLSYVSDDSPGIERRGHGRDFDYVDPRGKRVREPRTIERIRRLAIPLAWKDVWICPSERGHIQAVGRDARGRKQYKYHENWRQVRDEGKFYHVVEFARALPRIRNITAKHLKLAGLPRDTQYVSRW